MMVDL